MRVRRVRAHPRSRGENYNAGTAHALHAGSSPLTRGKRRRRRGDRQSRGLIPAHAGKTRFRRQRTRSPRAHPRSRGENEEFKKRYDAGEGSSPLTRGKLSSDAASYEDAGLIPAHAGKTLRTGRTRQTYRAHPRSRGENDARIRSVLHRDGSSPLTRGKQLQGQVATPGVGLIPAHAGKTPPSRRAGAGGRAHPRSRGENEERLVASPRLTGSSPLTRGKRDKPRRVFLRARLIPAHAGKT